jgi:two-component system cell cycle sensor histidine kinase/response regulator CckA
MPTTVDAQKIMEVATQLVTNSAEAIDDSGGSITVATGEVECDIEFLKQGCFYEDQPAGIYVFLRVSDDGSGMDGQVCSRMFDPYFTTKFHGRGLGLAAIIGIVRGHRGAIHVESSPAQGTEITVFLPVNAAPPGAERPDGLKHANRADE